MKLHKNKQSLQIAKELKEGGKVSLRSLSRSMAATYSENLHARVMWAAGFRKGIKQVLHKNDRSLVRMQLRLQKGREKDRLWAAGFKRGVNFLVGNVKKV